MKTGRWLGLGLLCSAMAACGGDATGPKSVVGSYILRSIDGNVLPVLYNTTNGQALWTAGNMTFNADNTFSESGTVSQAGVNRSISISGTYSLSGATVTVVIPATNGVEQATWSGNTISLNDGGDIFVFTR